MCRFGLLWRSQVFVCTFALFVVSGVIAADEGQEKPQKDVIQTKTGDVTITFIGHGTLMFQYKGKIIHVDPWSKLADYGKLPKADIVLITHEHRDHLDKTALGVVRKNSTVVIVNKTSAEAVPGAMVMKNGDVKTLDGFKVRAVPAYNIIHERPGGQPYHPKGNGNGYVITLGKTRVYVAGDTEFIPEMRRLKKINIAFLPMNLPYTMTPEMVADAARVIKPGILYPYHYGRTDPKELTELLADCENIEVRIRKMN